MFQWLTKLFAGNHVADMERQRNVLSERFRKLKAKYDAAQGDSQAKHWANADALSANLANSWDVRNTIRNRVRYEVANNSYAKGVVLTWANELIGRGPRLQMRLTGKRADNRQVEMAWREWDQASGFSEKLHVFAQSKVGDGEGQSVITSNPLIPFPVKLDISPIEAEMLTTQGTNIKTPVDGIEYDTYGNVRAYHVLKNHPSEGWQFGQNVTRRIDPRFFLHWFRSDRPGQARGISELTPSLGLFAQLRRWTLATLTGAETAANFAAVLSTKGSPETNAQAEPWDHNDIEMATMLTLPEGWEMHQFEPMQPVSTYNNFKHELLKEIARCLNMPFNVVAGDSSLMNYASGRLDFQSWYRSVKVARASFERVVLEHVFREWLEEASITRTLRGAMILPASLDIRNVPHGWFYDAVPHVDPVKDGVGDQLALANNTDTLANLCAIQGQDWEEVLEQRGQEVTRMRELGLDIYLPDFAMEVQRDIAEGGDSDSAKANYIRQLVGGRN